MINTEIKLAKIEKKLRGMKKRGKNMTPVFRRIAAVMVEAVEENFDAGGRYDSAKNMIGGGKRWEDHAPTTVKTRTAKGTLPKARRPILEESGRMIASLDAKASSKSATVSVGVEYAEAHQFGATINGTVQIPSHKRGNSTVRAHTRKVNIEIPARPFMNIQPHDLDEILDDLGTFIVDG